jgi:hypothetical protein
MRQSRHAGGHFAIFVRRQIPVRGGGCRCSRILEQAAAEVARDTGADR